MSQPQRRLRAGAAEDIVARYAGIRSTPETSYATVRDYCDSVDHLPENTGLDGDLKNVQRPWAAKSILQCVRPPARLLEIGGGEPLLSEFLCELGYDATLIDPYDGSGNGPTDYERYRERFPQVKIVRALFTPSIRELASQSFDIVFSVSVLEHLLGEALRSCFEAVGEFLRPGGASIHCFDFILQGIGDAHDLENASQILAGQSRLTEERSVPELPAFLEKLKADVDTFYLSPQGHHHWRAGRPYDEFPFRKVVSLQTIAFRDDSARNF